MPDQPQDTSAHSQAPLIKGPLTLLAFIVERGVMILYFSIRKWLWKIWISLQEENETKPHIRYGPLTTYTAKLEEPVIITWNRLLAALKSPEGWRKLRRHFRPSEFSSLEILWDRKREWTVPFISKSTATFESLISKPLTSLALVLSTIALWIFTTPQTAILWLIFSGFFTFSWSPSIIIFIMILESLMILLYRLSNAIPFSLFPAGKITGIYYLIAICVFLQLHEWYQTPNSSISKESVLFIKKLTFKIPRWIATAVSIIIYTPQSTWRISKRFLGCLRNDNTRASINKTLSKLLNQKEDVTNPLTKGINDILKDISKNKSASTGILFLSIFLWNFLSPQAAILSCVLLIFYFFNWNRRIIVIAALINTAIIPLALGANNISLAENSAILTYYLITMSTVLHLFAWKPQYATVAETKIGIMKINQLIKKALIKLVPSAEKFRFYASAGALMVVMAIIALELNAIYQHYSPALETSELTINYNEITINGNVSTATNKITINGEEIPTYTPGSSEYAFIPPPLTPGINTFTIIAIDEYGNQSSARILTIDYRPLESGESANPLD